MLQLKNERKRLGGSVKMKRRKILLGMLSMLLAFSLIGCGEIDTEADNHSVQTKQQEEVLDNTYDLMEVHFLDVGQGDCTLIKCGDAAMVIDTSTSDQGTAIQNYLSKNGVDKLDYLVLTQIGRAHV